MKINLSNDVVISPKYLNRHGLITGVTGSGKSNTIKLMVEQLHNVGTPSFVVDIKGDISALGNELDVNFIDYTGHKGSKVSLSIQDLGILRLAHLLDVKGVKRDVLRAVLMMCKDKGIEINSIDNLKDMLDACIEMVENKTYPNEYGRAQKSTLETMHRSALALNDMDMGIIFNETNFKLRNVTNTTILNAEKLYHNERAYGAIILKLLNDILIDFDEVGDTLDTPRLAVFIDEAHLLFRGADKTLINEIEKVIALVRSKGVAIIFITQLPQSIPSGILSQLTFKIHHRLNLNSVEDRKGINLIADVFVPLQEKSITKELLPKMETGQALISYLNDNGLSEFAFTRASLATAQGLGYNGVFVPFIEKQAHSMPLNSPQSNVGDNNNQYTAILGIIFILFMIFMGLFS